MPRSKPTEACRLEGHLDLRDDKNKQIKKGQKSHKKTPIIKVLENLQEKVEENEKNKL